MSVILYRAGTILFKRVSVYQFTQTTELKSVESVKDDTPLHWHSYCPVLWYFAQMRASAPCQESSDRFSKIGRLIVCSPNASCILQEMTRQAVYCSTKRALLDKLIKHCANFTDHATGNTFLHLAAAIGHQHSCSLLLG
jgi:hypothetical protein